ncbi:MAG: diguanylate cyclase domain-containing protein [Vulcanimicrobiaceae bacterium]
MKSEQEATDVAAPDARLASLATDAEGRIVAWPASAERLFGWPADGALGSTFAGLGVLRGEDARSASIALELVTRGGGPCSRIALTFDSAGSSRSRRWVVFELDASAGGHFTWLVEDLSPERDDLAQLASREQLYRSIFATHPDAMALYALDGTVLLGNKAAISLAGDHKNAHFSEHIAPECRAVAFEAAERARTGEFVQFETVFVDRSGTRVEVSASLFPVYGCDRLIGVCGIAKDISVLRRAQKSLAKQMESHRLLYRATASHADTLHEQIQASLQLGCLTLRFDCAYVTAYEDDRMLVTHTLDCEGRPEVGDLVPRATESLVVEEYSVLGEPFGLAAFESRRQLAGPLSASDQDFLRLTARFIGSAIERRERERRLDAMAYYDALTRLPNRFLLQDRLRQAMATAEREGQRLAVHFVDLDRFKRVNDSFGHAVGDELLVQVAQRLRATLRKSDSIARLGGDEFIVVQPKVARNEDALCFAAKVIAALEVPFSLSTGCEEISASVGIALFPSDAREPDALIRLADEALLRAKGVGGRAVLYRAGA